MMYRLRRADGGYWEILDNAARDLIPSVKAAAAARKASGCEASLERERGIPNYAGKPRGHLSAASKPPK
jgi:hypothetical protein